MTGQTEWQIRSACLAFGSDLTACMLQSPGLAAPDRIRIRNSIVPSNTPAVYFKYVGSLFCFSAAYASKHVIVSRWRVWTVTFSNAYLESCISL